MPAAETLKVADLPAVTVRAEGCEVILGAVPKESLALAEVTEPEEFLMTTE